MTTELSMLDGHNTTGQGGHGVSGGHQRCGVGMGGRLADSICEPHTAARGLVAGRRIRGVQGRQRCACDLGCMWSFGPAPVVLWRAGIMTNRQTRRIWWRSNGRLPACFSGRLVLLSNGCWRRFWRCGWLGVPLPRPSRCLYSQTWICEVSRQCRRELFIFQPRLNESQESGSRGRWG